MKHPMQVMMDRRRNGEKIGIPSYCTAIKPPPAKSRWIEKRLKVALRLKAR